MADFTINQALVRAQEIFTARSTDARLTSPEQTQAAETVTALGVILGRLGGGNVLAPNRRNQAFNSLVERRNVLNIINDNHAADIPAPEFYNALELMHACEEPLQLGLDEIISADG